MAQRPRLARRPGRGRVGAGVVFAVGEAQDSRFLLALAYVGFFLNLFNLVPIGFLDGGHLMRSWSVLRRGGGHADPAAARRLGWVVAGLCLRRQPRSPWSSG